MPASAHSARFHRLWLALGAVGDSAPVADDLLARWSEPHRHYHTLAHLETCLVGLDVNRSLAADATAIEAALWFHDAIYDPRAPDNEARSAALAVSVFRAAGVADATTLKIERLILATRTHEAAADPDTVLLLDLDLAILGASPAAYHAYAAAIRREYAWAPEADYRRKRAAVLARFLERPRLYLTAPFFARHETAARANLAAEIAALEGPSIPRPDPGSSPGL
jgi:predicted metal-dependent HD superfamily phosphohydrolase